MKTVLQEFIEELKHNNVGYIPKDRIEEYLAKEKKHLIEARISGADIPNSEFDKKSAEEWFNKKYSYE